MFDHDLSMGEFDACDPARCKFKSSKADARVSLQSGMIGAVSFFALLNFGPSTAQRTI